MHLINRTILFVTLGLLAGCAGAGTPPPGQPGPDAAQATAADSASAHEAAVGFIAAFDSLHWGAFQDYFADDVTMFFPFPQIPARVEGRAAVAAVFGQFMTSQRERRTAAGQPLVQGIVPRDLRIQMAGADVAIASFHLGGDPPSRRSVVFRRTGGEWKVLHWHASPAPPAPRAAAAPEPQTAVPLTPADIARYEGTYNYVSSGAPRELRVFGEGGQLVGQIVGGPLVRLRYQGEHTFIAEIGNDTRIVFNVAGERAESITIHQRGETIQGTRKP